MADLGMMLDALKAGADPNVPAERGARGPDAARVQVRFER